MLKSTVGLALLIMLVAKAGYSQAIATIDNPGFRQLNLAAPLFKIAPTMPAKKGKSTAVTGRQELQKLLKFSGYFKLVSDKAFSDLPQTKKGVAAANGTEDIDFSQWKTLNVETLVLGELFVEGGQRKVKLRAFDVPTAKLLVGKVYSYTGIKSVVRRFADLVLSSYTGLPGIFSSKIAFIGRRTKKSDKQVFMADFDGTNLKQITRAKNPHVSPTFSPDGRFITYTSFENANPDIYMYDTKTGRKTRVTFSKGLDSGANWSANGKVIAYSGGVGGKVNIYTVNAKDRKNRKVLIQGNGLDVDPTFSPDGKYMAFVSGRYGNPHIFAAKLAWSGDTSVKVISDKRLTYAGWYNATPDWSPDSKKIVFAGYDKDIDRFDIFMMNPDGKNIERLTLKTGDNESPSFSPNGQLIVFQSNRIGSQNIKGVAKIYMMHRDGTNQRRLNLGLYEAQTPTWSKNATK